jgi:hypothetical protein
VFSVGHVLGNTKHETQNTHTFFSLRIILKSVAFHLIIPNSAEIFHGPEYSSCICNPQIDTGKSLSFFWMILSEFPVGCATTTYIKNQPKLWHHIPTNHVFHKTLQLPPPNKTPEIIPWPEHMRYRNNTRWNFGNYRTWDQRREDWSIQFTLRHLRNSTTDQFSRFEGFTAVTMKNGVFWDVTPCGSCKNRRFGGT